MRTNRAFPASAPGSTRPQHPHTTTSDSLLGQDAAQAFDITSPSRVDGAPGSGRQAPSVPGVSLTGLPELALFAAQWTVPPWPRAWVNATP